MASPIVANDTVVHTGSVTTTAETIEINRALGRGINFGNALDAPEEGLWGEVIEDDWFDLVAEAGFDSIRVPIRWSAHSGVRQPYAIDEVFFDRVDHVIEQARRVKLPVILNIHHYDALMDDPRSHGSRFVALWKQIADRYSDEPHSVLFELLNEPSGLFNDDPASWNSLLALTLEAIRHTNPQRPVIVGPVGFNGIEQLDQLRLPPDPNLIISVHFYSPMAFTHQGAEWATTVHPTGTQWRPDQRVLGIGVENWSWDTSVNTVLDFLKINFEKQHGGFSLHFQQPIDPALLRLRIRGKVDLAIGCTFDDVLQWVTTLASEGDQWVDLEVALDGCPRNTQRIGLMNRFPGTSSFELASVQICNDSGCQSLLAMARDMMEDRLNRARDWGMANGRPMHLGEFGAYNAADHGSRVSWTAEVQRLAGEAGLSTAYWALGTKFGIYNSISKSWDQPLLDVLLP